MLAYFLDPYKCIPLDVVDHLSKVDFKVYRSQGFKTLFIDVDNTLIPYDNRDYQPWHEALKTAIVENGFQVVLVSNNARVKIQAFAEAFAAPFVARAQKPAKIGFQRALKMAGADITTTLMIGDQLMTDVYGANRLGIQSILVKPIRQKSEKWYTKITRRLENQMLKRVLKINPEMYQKINEVHRD